MKNNQNWRHFLAAIILASSAQSCLSAESIEQTGIEPQPLNTALKEFADNSGLQVVYLADVAANVSSKGAAAELSDNETLNQLLNSTGLQYEFLNERTVAITDGRQGLGNPQPTSNKMLLAQAGTSAPQSPINSRPLTHKGNSDSGQFGLEEIVVTAQKRAESIQSVPIAINALTGDMMDEVGIFDADDIENVFVNLSTKNSSAANSGFSIRGVGTDSFHISGQQSVGTYVDNVYAVSPFVSTIGLYDMERVEVLRGPQNTLYGRNTTGGAVNFHSNKARIGEGFVGYGRVGAGSGGTLNFESALGFDLGDSAAGRIAVMDNSFDGLWTYANTGEDAGGYEKSGVRASLVWDLSEATSVTAIYSHGEAEGDDMLFRYDGALNADGTGPCAGADSLTSNLEAISDCTVAITPPQALAEPTLAAMLADGQFAPNPNPGPTLLFAPGLPLWQAWDIEGDGYSAEFDTFNVYLTHEFEQVQFDSVTSYSTSEIQTYRAFDLTGFAGAQQGDWEVWQQELRLASTGSGKLRWLAGLYLSTQESQEDTWAVVSIAGATNSILIDSDYDAWSVYGQADYDLTDSLSVTAGVRYTDDKLEASRYDKLLCAGPTAVPNTTVGGHTYNREFREANCTDISASLATRNPTQELTELGWKLGLNWQLDDEILLYGNVSEGFKGGAYDNRALANGTNPIDPEFLTAYEVGLKSSFLDNRVQLNLSAYLYDWEGLQIFEVIAGIPSLTNIPETELKGMEAELKWIPSEGWFIQAALGLSDNEISDTTGLPAGSGAREGNQITHAPDTTANLLASYSFPVNWGEITLMASYRYADEHFLDLDNAPRSLEQARSYLNARGSLAFGEELQHSVSIWGNNLNEELGCNSIENGPGVGQNFGCGVEGFGEAVYGATVELQF